MYSPLKSFVKKKRFLIGSFAIIFVIMNEHTCKLFTCKNILNDVQINDNGEINTAQHNYSKKNCILILFRLKGMKSKFLLILRLYITIKECITDAGNESLFDLSDQYACTCKLQLLLPVALMLNFFCVYVCSPA